MSQPDDTIPYGFCHCGCGRKTSIAKANNRRLGQIKGDPKRYARGCNGARKSSPVDWIEVDRGYITSCHIWQRRISEPAGYGSRWVVGVGNVLAHRSIYEETYGPIPAKMQIDHLCRNRSCVNPDHMEVVTNAVNSQRGSQAKLNPDDVRRIRSMGGAMTHRAIAKEFGVSHANVQAILNGKQWKNV